MSRLLSDWIKEFSLDSSRATAATCMSSVAKRLARAQPRPVPTPKTIAVLRDDISRSLHSLGWPFKKMVDCRRLDSVVAARADHLLESLFLPRLGFDQHPEDHQV